MNPIDTITYYRHRAKFAQGARWSLLSHAARRNVRIWPMQTISRVYKRTPDLWIVLAIMLLAAALRLPALSTQPPGFYHDEAYNGSDAQRIMAGELPVFFDTNGGREAGFMYFVAIAQSILGPSPAAVRVVSAAMGILTIPATYLLGKALYDRRIGALAAAILAIMIVPVHLSRIGFRVVSVPFALSWFLWRLVAVWKSGKGWHWGLAGLLYGLTFHTYTASRITPFALALVVIYLVAIKKEGRRLWPGGLWFALGAALTAAPLIIYALNNPDAYFTRTTQTAALSGGLAHLLGQMVSTAGMFFVRGDSYPRHNALSRPFFDPLLAVWFVWGLWVLWRERRETRSAFIVVWLAVTAQTTMLSVDPPHFLRTTPMFPLLVVVPAVGLDAAYSALRKRVQRPLWSGLALVGALVISLAFTVRAYFSPAYRQSEDTYYQMDSAAVEMALEVNQFVAMGWQGESWTAHNGEVLGSVKVYMPEALWNFSETNRYLIPLEFGVAPLLVLESPDDVPDTAGQGFKLLVLPGQEADYAAALPGDGIIYAYRGPMARADLEVGEAPFTVYVTYVVEAGWNIPEEPVFEFEAGMSLLNYVVLPAGRDTVFVRTVWRAESAIEADYTLFVHVLSDGQTVGQMDGPIAEGLYPTSWWRVGDVVVDERTVPLAPGTNPAEVVVNAGFYLPEDGVRVGVVNGGDFVILDNE